MKIERNGEEIQSVEAWFRAAPPKGGADHWVAGRSARELASAWCGTTVPCVPVDIQSLLASSPHLRGTVIDRVFPEHKIRFDDLRGEPRNADLAIMAHDSAGEIAITVEGKADEPFDQPVESVLRRGIEKIAADQRTGTIRRIERFAATLLPSWREGLPHVGQLRYQLLTAVAGSIAWAQERSADRAVLLIHEFVTTNTRDANHDRNAADLNAFVARMTDGVVRQLPSGCISEPISLPTASFTGRLFIGKATTRLR